MNSRRLPLGCLLSLLLFAVTAWAQTARYAVPAASVDHSFSAYDQALSDAADDQLATAATRAPQAQTRRALLNTLRTDDSELHDFAGRYWDGKDENVRRAVERVAMLRPTLEPILREEGVPIDAAALVLVESGGRASALSPKGARGLWQFMPETARRYGLSVTPALDERLDIVKSTHAAAHYLRDLYAQFGDWKLVFAAYNAGAHAVERAMQRGTGSFDDMHRDHTLPLETRNYVPAVMAAMHLLGESLPKAALPQKGFNNAQVLYAESAPNH